MCVCVYTCIHIVYTHDMYTHTHTLSLSLSLSLSLVESLVHSSAHASSLPHPPLSPPLFLPPSLPPLLTHSLSDVNVTAWIHAGQEYGATSLAMTQAAEAAAARAHAGVYV